MKKIFLLVAVIALFSLSACGALGGGAEEAPPAAEPVDLAATVDAQASTQAVETLNALPTSTMEPAPTDEPTATAIEEMAPTEEAVATETPSDEAPTETPAAEDAADSAAEPTATPENTATPEATSTPAPTATSVYPSPTSPIAIQLPPEDLVPRHKVEVTNKTKGSVYISFQGTTEYGYRPIVDYDIPRFATVKYEVPEGFYTVIVYVGKDPMIAYTGVYHNNQIAITIFQDELKIEK